MPTPQPNEKMMGELERLLTLNQEQEKVLQMLKYLEGANDALRAVSMLNLDYTTRLPEGYLEQFNRIILQFAPPKEVLRGTPS